MAGEDDGMIDKAKGRAKKAVGDLADDSELKREGSEDESRGEAKEELAEAKQEVEEKAREVERRDD